METTTPDQSRLATQLSQELFSRYSLTVSTTWLSDFLNAVRKPPPPLPALVSTANFRLLNSDFTQSLSRTSTAGTRPPPLLPPGVADVNTKHSQLQTNVPVQVLDIVDVGSSLYSQIEAIERIERGEEIRGREVIRSVPIMNEEDGSGTGAGGNATAGTGTGAVAAPSIKKSAGPHRLLLQDAAGAKVWGFELVAVPKVFITMTVEEGGLQIGAKLLLKRDLVVRRGLVMLEPANVVVMGGKLEERDRKWRAGRKRRLMDDLKRQSERQQTTGG